MEEENSGWMDEDEREELVTVVRRFLKPTGANGARKAGSAEDLLLHSSDAQLQETIDALAQLTKWFRDLPGRRRADFLAKAQFEHFPPRRTVCRQGDPADKFYIILRGSLDVKISVGKSNVSKWKTVASLGSGQTFGDLSLMANSPRNASCVTSVPSELLSLDKESFLTLARERRIDESNDPDGDGGNALMDLRWWRKHVSCMSGVSDAVVAGFTQVASVFRFAEDHELSIGATTLLYFVKSGRVQIVKDGKPLKELSEGSFVGDASLFGLAQGQWLAKMLTPVVFLVIPHQYLTSDRVPKYLMDRLCMEAEIRYTYCAPRAGADCLRSRSQKWFLDRSAATVHIGQFTRDGNRISPYHTYNQPSTAQPALRPAWENTSSGLGSPAPIPSTEKAATLPGHRTAGTQSSPMRSRSIWSSRAGSPSRTPKGGASAKKGLSPSESPQRSQSVPRNRSARPSSSARSGSGRVPFPGRSGAAHRIVMDKETRAAYQ